MACSCFCSGFISGAWALLCDTSCPSAARDGDVGHAVVEQVFGSQLGIDVNQHTVGGLPLARMSRVHAIALPKPVIAAAKPLPAFFSPCFSHG